MEIEIVEVLSPIGSDKAITLYVVRLRQRVCIHMDFYAESMRDFGAYESYGMAEAVANAIKNGDIKVALDL